MQVDDRSVSEPGERFGVDGSRREEIRSGAVRNGRDHGMDDLGAVVEDDPHAAELRLDRADGRAEDDPRACLPEDGGGRIAVQPLQWHRRDADVAGRRRVEQARAKHLNRLGERRLVGRDVHRRKRDQVPERRDRVLRLPVGPQPVAERDQVELGNLGIEPAKGRTGAQGSEPLAKPERRIAEQRGDEMERRRELRAG